MEIAKISLLEAYMIETLRSNGIGNEQILQQIMKKDVEQWQDELDTRFNFKELIKLAEQDAAAFQSIILDGYKVKFVTIKGIQNLLKLKFHKQADTDYVVTGNGIADLRVNREQLTELKKMLSANWAIRETPVHNAVHITIELPS